MANLIHRFIKNQSILRAVPRLTPNLVPHQKPCLTINNNNVESVSDPAPLANPVITFSASGIKPDEEALRFYPSFPIGYGLDPSVVRGFGLIDSVVEEEKDEKEVVIRADSVKKKRKKKMNKHKYRKLRKEQGRKS